MYPIKTQGCWMARCTPTIFVYLIAQGLLDYQKDHNNVSPISEFLILNGTETDDS